MEYKKIYKIEVEDVNDKIVYDIQLNENHYFSANDIITHNCRLKNKIQSKEFNFTNGNIGIETGSKSVITLNLSRIAQDWYAEEFNDKRTTPSELPFKEIMKHKNSLKKYICGILDRVYKYQTCYNEILWDMYSSGLLPIYKAGFIHLDKQYLTIGLNGFNQMANFLGVECTVNNDYEQLSQFVFGLIKESNEKHNGDFNGHKLSFNTELIPAESLGIKNYNWDKADGYWVPEDINLYTSYMYKPYDKEISLLDKIRLHGRNYIGDYLDGGSAAHLNLSEHLSLEQYKHLLKFAAETGCQYFTFNCINSCCPKCGYITKRPLEKCPHCGTKMDWYDRVIGYLTKINFWSEGRKLEQQKRVYQSSTEVGC